MIKRSKRRILLVFMVISIMIMNTLVPFAATKDSGNPTRYLVDNTATAGSETTITELQSNNSKYAGTAMPDEQLTIRTEGNFVYVSGKTSLPPELSVEGKVDKDPTDGRERNYYPAYIVTWAKQQGTTAPESTTAPKTGIANPQGGTDNNGNKVYYFNMDMDCSGASDGIYRMRLFRGFYTNKGANLGNKINVTDINSDIMFHNAYIQVKSGKPSIIIFNNIKDGNAAAEDELSDYDESVSYTDPSLAEIAYAMKNPQVENDPKRALTADEMSYIKGVAQGITKGISDDYDKAKAIYEWIANNVYYDDARPGNTGSNPANSNPYLNIKGIEDKSSNNYNIVRGKAATNCVGYAAMFAALGRSVGLKVRIINGYHIDNKLWSDITGNINALNHHWNQFYYEGEWITVDCNMGSGNHKTKEGEYKGHGLSNYTFFNPTDEQFAQNFHTRSVYTTGEVAHEHDLVKTAAKAATCTKAGNKEYWTCKECSRVFSDSAGKNETTVAEMKIPATGHKMVKTAAKAATCTEAGNKAYWTCSNCNKVFSDADGKTETTVAKMTIKALGHSYGDWTKLNASQHQKVCKNDSSHVVKEDHKWDGGKVTKEPTEEATGVKTYTCSVCKATKTEAIPKLDHVHKLVKTAAKAATCTEAGNKAYWTCSGCKKVFSDSKGTTETTVAKMTIKALGHNYGDWTKLDANQHQKVCKNDSSHVVKENHKWDEGKVTKEPTEEATGVKTYTCSVCKATKTETIPKLDHVHKLVKTAAKAATCTAVGNKAYWTCSKCNKVFSDSKGTNETTVANMTIKALGHDYGDWTKIDANQHQKVCKNDSTHVVKEDHKWDAGKVTKAATEEATGVKTYTCSVCKATKTETIPKLDHVHKLVKTDAKVATCTAAGNKAYWTCSGCKKVFSDSKGATETTVAKMTIKALGHNYGDWTKLNASQHQKVCKNDSSHVVKEDHKWDSGKVTKEPTEEATGVKTYTCSVCKATKTETIPKLDHTHQLVKTDAKAATCTAAGNKAYWTCSKCNKVFSDSKGTNETTVANMTIKALGHDYGDWTKIDANQHQKVCKNDSTHVVKENHKWDAGKVTTEPTETAEGVKTFTCTVCKATKTESIPKVEPVVEKTLRRAYGDNRYDTGFAIADAYIVDSGRVKSTASISGTKRKATLDTIIVACGTDFPDALSSSYLAKVKKAPVIVWREKDNERVQEYIRANLKPGGRVYLIGGRGAVGKSIDTKLAGYKITRLEGEDRYGTNVRILNGARVKSGEILVCDGTNFENALIASATGKPILLVKPSGVTKDGLDFLAGLQNASFTIIGNEKSVSASVATQLEKYGKVTRVTGANPDQVSVNVAKKYFTNPKEVVVATSSAFPDALCGGILAIQNKAPMLLVTEAQNSKSMAYTKTLAKLERVTALGGRAVVSDALAKSLLNVGTAKVDTLEYYRNVVKGKGNLVIGSIEA